MSTSRRVLLCLWLAVCGGTGQGAPSWSDEFDHWNASAWDPASWLGGWNGEFHFYTGPPSNKSKNLLVQAGELRIQPDLTANYKPDGQNSLGWESVLGCGRRDANGSVYSCPSKEETPWFAPEECSVSDPSMCNNTAGLCQEESGLLSDKCSYSVLPPVTSGQIRTRRSFKFGRLEVRARLPRGDWLWPAIWLLPTNSKYGGWPTSGEIDIMESRGNKKHACGPWQGRAAFGSTLHFGPDATHNAFLHTHTETHLGDGKDLSDEYHIYGLEWKRDGLYTYLDNPNNTVLVVDFDRSFWDRGSHWGDVCFQRVDGKCTSHQPRWPAWHNDTAPNPWANGTEATPFDEEFFLQINLAVGGTGAFFPDLLCKDKPWHNSQKSSSRAHFLSRIEQWWPTWGGDLQNTARGADPNASLAVDWVRYWEQSETRNL